VRYLVLFLPYFSFKTVLWWRLSRPYVQTSSVRAGRGNKPKHCFLPFSSCCHLAVKSHFAQALASPHACLTRESLIPPQPLLLPQVVLLSPHCCDPLFLCRLTGNEPLTILPLTSEMEEAAVKAHYKVCDRLKLEKKQRRMCRRDPGVAETLMEAISMSALECQYQFRFERWNCTLEGRYRASLLKRGEQGWGSWLGVLTPQAPISFPGILQSGHSGASFASSWVTTSPEVQKELVEGEHQARLGSSMKMHSRQTMCCYGSNSYAYASEASPVHLRLLAMAPILRGWRCSCVHLQSVATVPPCLYRKLSCYWRGRS